MGNRFTASSSSHHLRNDGIINGGDDDRAAHAKITTNAMTIVDAADGSRANGGEGVRVAKVLGSLDPDCEVARVLDVGKDMKWEDIVTILTTTKESIPIRYRALTLAYEKAPSKSALVDTLTKALDVQTVSMLLRHEIAYFLGQVGNERALGILRKLLNDEAEEDIVRHEAAEAIWAVCCLSGGKHEALDDVVKFVDHKNEPLAHTCKLVKAGIEWELDESSSEEEDADTAKEKEDTKTVPSPKKVALPICACQSKLEEKSDHSNGVYHTFDPAGSIPDATPKMIPQLGRTLRDQSKNLMVRYRAMFTLRNLGGSKAVSELCRALENDTSSAIMRHEIAFVLGQMASTCDKSHESIPCLINILARPNEHGMVRHEAALALGCLGTWNIEAYRSSRRALERYAKDTDPLVAESCECALDDIEAPIDWVGKDGW